MGATQVGRLQPRIGLEATSALCDLKRFPETLTWILYKTRGLVRPMEMTAQTLNKRYFPHSALGLVESSSGRSNHSVMT